MAADAERNMQLGSGKNRVVDRHDPVCITSVFVLHVGGTRVVSLGVLVEVFIYTSNCFHLFRWCLTDMTTTIYRLFSMFDFPEAHCRCSAGSCGWWGLGCPTLSSAMSWCVLFPSPLFYIT